MAFQIMRKLSLRKRSQQQHRSRSPEEKFTQCASSASNAELSSPETRNCNFSGSLLQTIVDAMPSNSQQSRTQSVDHDILEHLGVQFNKIKKMIVSKEFLIERCTHSSWRRLGNAQICVRSFDDTVDIVVDEKWTARDTECLAGLIALFRMTVQEVIIDAPIAELLIASLSDLDLQQWYSMQCLLKMNNNIESTPAPQPYRPPVHWSEQEAFWPNVTSLTVKTTQQQTLHLSRVLDYGVVAQHVFDRRKLADVKVLVTDASQNHKALARNVFPFRCWAGSAGFDHRFKQEFAVKKTLYC